MAWVTSLPVSRDNVADIVACGRARWKIENESFNVLKNHGYELEHNFGHGQRFLAMTLAALNLLAFAWHTVLELLEPPWQAAREAAVKRTSFFAHVLMLSAYVIFPSWRVFLQSLATFSIPPFTGKTRSSSIRSGIRQCRRAIRSTRPNASRLVSPSVPSISRIWPRPNIRVTSRHLATYFV